MFPDMLMTQMYSSTEIRSHWLRMMQRPSLHCSRVQERPASPRCTQHLIMHLVRCSWDAAARPWKPLPSTVPVPVWRPREVWRSALKTSASSDFGPWFLRSTIWLSCCRSQSLPLCYLSYTVIGQHDHLTGSLTLFMAAYRSIRPPSLFIKR